MTSPTGVAAQHDDYVDFCKGIQRLSTIDLLRYKRGQMERRIRTFAERRGAAELPGYLQILRSQPEELEQFLDRVTINVSELWRNPEQWQLLERQIVPDLAQAGRIRALSAGCSYGAEAFTVAATCLTAAPRAKTTIAGVDIDRRMVERARQARFSASDARGAPREALDRWFTPRDDGGWDARPELRAICRFDVGDLLELRPREQAYDLVLCRNTVIYFTDDVRDDVHARLATALRPGGYLIVGATERVSDPAARGLELTRPFTYRKL